MKSLTQYYHLTFAFEEVTTETSKAGFNDKYVGLRPSKALCEEAHIVPPMALALYGALVYPKVEMLFLGEMLLFPKIPVGCRETTDEPHESSQDTMGSQSEKIDS